MSTASIKKLAIGSAQFGLDYGLSSIGQPVPEREVRSILELAAQNDIELIDTAAAYGTAEAVLGKTIDSDLNFRIVSKIPSTNSITGVQEKLGFIKECFENSLEKLKRQNIHALLLHNADELVENAGAAIFDLLEDWKQQGLVEKIGVSAYEHEKIEEIIDRYQFDVIQIPINVFDQRLLSNEFLSGIKSRGIEIHARSAFLQGLLLITPENLPRYFQPIEKHIASWHDFARNIGLTPLEAALIFLREIEEIDYIIVGTRSREQLEETIASFQKDSTFDASMLACEEVEFIDPRMWPAL